MAAPEPGPTPPAETGAAVKESKELAEIRRRSEAMTESMRTSLWGKPAPRPEASEPEVDGEADDPPAVSPDVEEEGKD